MDVFTLPTLSLPALPDVFYLIALTSLKAALLVALAGTLAWLLRAQSASLRHAVWSVAVAGVLVLPLLTLALPTWRVAVETEALPEALRPTADAVVGKLARPEAAPLPSAPPAPPAEMPAAVAEAQAALRAMEREVEAQHPSNELALLAAREARAALEAEREAAVPPAPAAPSAFAPAEEEAWSWAQVVLGVWLLGVLVVLGYFAAGGLRVWWWTRRARPVSEGAWNGLALDVAWELYLERRVKLFWTDRASMPLTWGIFRPVVLLPESARDWDDERRRVVLMHELAHIERWDTLTQTLAQVACALNWFNPLVWVAARRLRVEREHACDDRVLHGGTKASTYADHLLQIARSFRSTPGTPFGAVAMAKKSEFEGRLMAILEPDAERGRPSPFARYGTAVLLVGALLPLAALQPLPTSADAPVQDWTTLRAEAEAVRQEADEVERAATQTSSDYSCNVSAEPRGTLDLRTDRGSIEVDTHDRDEVQVRVETRGVDEDDFELRCEGNDGDVTVRGIWNEERRDGWFNNQRIELRVTVPEHYDLDVHTSGGSIDVEDLTGDVKARTSGGSLAFGDIVGDVDGHTSGGSIGLDGARGDVLLRTSGGSIRVGDVRGVLDVHTSGGSIRLGAIDGPAKAHTSGGSIAIDEVGGRLDAQTSGGSIRATLTRQPQGASRLHTSGGSVTVELAENLRLDLKARASNGRIHSDWGEPPEEGPWRRLDEELNGGGPELDVHTSAGSITIRSIGARSDAGYDAGRNAGQGSGTFRASVDWEDEMEREIELQLEQELEGEMEELAFLAAEGALASARLGLQAAFEGLELAADSLARARREQEHYSYQTDSLEAVMEAFGERLGESLEDTILQSLAASFEAAALSGEDVNMESDGREMPPICLLQALYELEGAGEAALERFADGQGTADQQRAARQLLNGDDLEICQE